MDTHAVADGNAPQRDAPGPSLSPLDKTLLELVEESKTSVRLANCVRSAPEVGAITVGRFLDDENAARGRLLQVRSLGRKTSLELCELVKDFAERAQGESAGLNEETSGITAAALVQPKPKALFQKLIALLEPIPFPGAVLHMEISTRLRRALESLRTAQASPSDPAASFRTLADVAANWPMFAQSLRGQKNLGSRTSSELRRLVEEFIGRRVASCHPGLPSAGLVSLDDIGEGSLREGSLAELVDGASEVELPPGAEVGVEELFGAWVNANADPRRAAAEVLSQLAGKEQDVILRRYGLQGFDAQTLEQVAEQFFVTRERVRQVEAKALKRLTSGERLLAFRHLLAAEGDDAWSILSGGSSLILPSDLHQSADRLDGLVRLAVDVVHGGLAAWAASQGQTALGGWVPQGCDVAILMQDVEVVRAWAREAPSPCPVEGVAAGLGVPDDRLRMALRLVEAVRPFEGYLCAGHLGQQARRTCRLHALALALPSDGPFDFASLLLAYRRAAPDDNVASRVVFLQLERAPHLFFRLFDHIWIALDPTRPDPIDRPLGAIPLEQGEVPDENQFEPSSIGSLLYEMLAAEGPQRVVDLRERAPAALAQQVAQSSIGAILQSYPCFVRIAPGVFGLQRHAAACKFSSLNINKFPFSEKHCRYYAMARKVGVPTAFYPGWTDSFEAGLCRWAERHASTEAFRSLLAVCTPEEWPLEAAEREFWTGIQRTHAKYSLVVPLQTIQPELPDASDFASAVFYLSLFGGISWVEVNRTAQRRLDNQVSVSTMALLAALGLTQPAKHWQDRHMPAPAAAGAADRIMGDLFRRGCLSWSEGTLAELRAAAGARDMGWCQAERMEMILSAEERSGGGRDRDGSGLGDLDAVFGGEDWASGFGA